MKEKMRITIRDAAGETAAELEGEGVVAFVSEQYADTEHIRRVTRAMIGPLNPADIANSILKAVRDDGDENGGEFWRKVVADIIWALTQDEDVTGEIGEAEAFMIAATEAAAKRSEEGGGHDDRLL